MKKFGLKKKDEGDEDSSRLALFGSRSKPKSPAPPAQNPYAQANIPPDPYTQAKMNAGIIPRTGPPPSPAAAAQPAYSSGLANIGHTQDNRYGPPQGGFSGDNKFGPVSGGQGGVGHSMDRYGNSGAYGSQKPGGNPYANILQTSGTSRYGPGGYGGFGPGTDDDAATDAGRDELFGGARQRAQQKSQYSSGLPPDYEYKPSAQDHEHNYGAYGDRQLTAEEEEEEDIEATKQEIKFIKQQDVSSTRNALQIAQQAEETGRNTLARLGAQSEWIHNTERNLDLAANHQRIAEDKARELKTLNRSMFAVHVNNPFTAKERRARRDEEIMERHRREREEREASREAAFKSTQRMNQNFKGLNDAQTASRTKASLAERAKYQFEADSDDDKMEDEIEGNLDALAGVTGRLNLLARATKAELDAQNDHLVRIAAKVSRPETLIR